MVSYILNPSYLGKVSSMRFLNRALFRFLARPKVAKSGGFKDSFEILPASILR